MSESIEIDAAMKAKLESMERAVKFGLKTGKGNMIAELDALSALFSMCSWASGRNAGIEESAKLLDSIADDFGAMGNDALMVAVQQHAAEVRDLAVEEQR